MSENTKTVSELIKAHEKNVAAAVAYGAGSSGSSNSDIVERNMRMGQSKAEPYVGGLSITRTRG